MWNAGISVLDFKVWKFPGCCSRSVTEGSRLSCDCLKRLYEVRRLIWLRIYNINKTINYVIMLIIRKLRLTEIIMKDEYVRHKGISCSLCTGNTNIPRLIQCGPAPLIRTGIHQTIKLWMNHSALGDTAAFSMTSAGLHSSATWHNQSTDLASSSRSANTTSPPASKYGRIGAEGLPALEHTGTIIHIIYYANSQ